MPDTTFDVSRYENRNGSISWRVTGWLDGLRIRKNFKSREEAAAEKAVLEIKALQATSGLRSLATTLTDEQVREAETVFHRLADKPRPLSFYLDFALANYREPENQKSLSDAIEDYKRAKAHEHKQGHLSADVSKVREPRRITIQPNLAAWLRAYPLTQFPIVVGNFKKRREKFRDRFNLSHDVLRHTFLSMFVAKFRSIGEAAIQAGNSESIIKKHYLDLKTPAEADEFFAIMPKHRNATVPAEAPAATAENAVTVPFPEENTALRATGYIQPCRALPTGRLTARPHCMQTQPKPDAFFALVIEFLRENKLPCEPARLFQKP